MTNANLFRRFAAVERATLLLAMPRTSETAIADREAETKQTVRVVVTVRNIGTSRLVRKEKS